MKLTLTSLVSLIFFSFPSYGIEKADHIYVSKSNRIMILFKGQKVLKKYPVALGFSPIGHKHQEGDGKTPEGLYKITYKNKNSQFFLSLKISYPNKHDRAQAAQRGVSPGGDIMVHGLRDDLAFVGKAHALVDWTNGCVAVTNDEIQQVWDMVEVGTSIEINP